MVYQDEPESKARFGSSALGGAQSPQFEKICTEARVTEKLAEETWKNYEIVSQRCSLEGDQLPWYATAIYLTAWQNADEIEQDDYRVSLFHLAQLSELTILEFFEKLTKWVEMATSSRRTQDHISRVQSTFAVSAVVFKKFLHLFREVFVTTEQMESPGKGKSKRQKKHADYPEISPAKLLEFCWILFISTKKNFIGIGDDLMNCFHLLLCCIGMVYRALLAAKRLELIKAEFAGVSEDEDFGILEQLCGRFEGVLLDAKHFQVHWWQPKMQKLLSEGMLSGVVEDGSLIDKIDENISELRSVYGEAMLERGEMDERAFLPKDVASLLAAPQSVDPLIGLKRTPEKSSTTVDTDLLLRLSVQSCFEKMSHYQLPTPLTGKSYTLPGDQFCPQTPLSSSAQVASKLSSLLLSGSSAPSEDLEHIFSQCEDRDTKQLVCNILHNIKSELEETCAKERKDFGPGYDESFTEFMEQRFEQAETLFYKFLERILLSEKERTSFDFTAALKHELFHRSLFACSLELIIFSYNSQRVFPWIIRALGLPAIHFYKVIELVIRAEPELSREMVKHLNTIEERVLEELAWMKDSPIWETLEHLPGGVPLCLEVALPSQFNKSTGLPTVMGGTARRPGDVYSPFGVTGRFQSPMKQSVLAKRKLDFGGTEDDDTTGSPPSKLVAREESGGRKQVLMTGLRLPGTANVFIESTGAAEEEISQQPHRSSSVTLFFRKVYYLASVRLSDLCERLRMDEKAKQHVWALFEHSLRNFTRLMCGRHMDQILMCCLYVVGKLSKVDVSFHDILSQYRYQPQAASRVYRSVLMDRLTEQDTAGSDESSRDSSTAEYQSPGKQLRSRSTLPVPSVGSAPPTPEPKEEEFGDLIRFYNRIFIVHLEEFAKKLCPPADSHTKENLGAMSPLPNVRSHALSPRKRVADGIYICPMQASGKPVSPSRPMRYNFSRSPYKDLKAINTMIRQGSEPSGSSSRGYSSSGQGGVRRVLNLNYASGR